MEVEKEEVRIRRVFGLLRGEKIPEVGLESFKTYQRYLETHLRVPFMAEFERELGPGKFVRIKIRLPGLEDIDELGDDLYGLICMEGWGERSSGLPF